MEPTRTTRGRKISRADVVLDGYRESREWT